ncbi:MAG: LPS export ABC transporter periplasmic protein LptC [Thermodesulfobacteriota bacterium]
MGKLKILLLTAVVALSLTSLVMFFNGGRVDFNPVRLDEALPQNVDMKLTGVNYTEVAEGQREWTMEASTLHYFKSKNLIVLDRVEATFHTKDGPMRVRGDRAYYDKEAKTVRLVGGIRAWDTQGNSLTTKEMKYNVTTGILLAPGNFQLTGPKLDLEGHGLSVDTRNSRLKVLSRPSLLVKSFPKTL